MSRWLADACAMIDVYTADSALPSSVRTLLENDASDVAVGATTIWEIAIKIARGKLADIRTDGHAHLVDMLEAQGFDLVSLDAETAEQAASLPPLHADPFDRALVALAQRSGRTVLTSDKMISPYAVPMKC